MQSLDEVVLDKKTVILRIDVNAPYDPEKNRIQRTDRFDGHGRTIRELLQRNAKVVLLAHQGRQGRDDFTRLEQHAQILSEVVGRDIDFVSDVAGDEAKRKILGLQPGKALLLDNVRLLDDETELVTPEEHASSNIVKELAPLADMFVNDAFSVSHRSHASVVGFTAVLPSYAGRIMLDEINSTQKAMRADRKNVLVVGGNKIDDVEAVIAYVLDTNPTAIEYVVTGGIIANAFLAAKGHELGERNRATIEESADNAIARAETILNKDTGKIIVPVDLAVKQYDRQELTVDALPTEHPIWDIGDKTGQLYCHYVSQADAVIVKGPLGRYEAEGFAKGTEHVLDCIRQADVFSMLGGGNTRYTALHEMDFSQDDFSHVSLAGGAFIAFLAGEELPGLAALDTTD